METLNTSKVAIKTKNLSGIEIEYEKAKIHEDFNGFITQEDDEEFEKITFS